MTTPTVAEVVARLRAMRSGVQLRSPVYAVSESPLRDVADLLEREYKARVEAERERDRWKLQSEDWQKRGWEIGKQTDALQDRAETAERELAALRNRPCPYVHSSGEGTHYCTLPNLVERERDELRKRMAEAPRGRVRGFMLEPETQPGWLDKMGGQRVAILLLREGE